MFEWYFDIIEAVTATWEPSSESDQESHESQSYPEIPNPPPNSPNRFRERANAVGNSSEFRSNLSEPKPKNQMPNKEIESIIMDWVISDKMFADYAILTENLNNVNCKL